MLAPDGNGEFTRDLGQHSWRHCMLVKDGPTAKMFNQLSTVGG